MPQKRKPNNLKVLQGTDRPDRMHDEVEFPPVESTDPPDWLIGPEAVKEWGERIGHMEAAGTLTDADLTALGHYCNMHADAVKRWRLNDKPTAADLTQLRMMFNEFGFTPTSRSKPAKVGTDKASNAFEKMKAG